MNKIITAIVELITALQSDSDSPLYFTNITDTPHGARRVFYGDPQQIPNDDFPLVAVRPVSSSIAKEGTKYDQRENLVEVVIIDNYRNYVNDNPSDPNKVFSLETLMNMMEKTGTDQKVSASSIVGKLLANPRLPYTESGTKYAAIAVRLQSVDYVFNISRGFPTFEVIASFRITSQGDRA